MIITISFIVILLLVYILLYNKIISSAKMAEVAWSDVDVQLERRHDLIPNLVELVKSYTKHEKVLLKSIINYRNQAFILRKKHRDRLHAVEDSLYEQLGSLFAVAESYPNLKANKEYLRLQEQIIETEDQIASSRRIYNGNVANYNTLIQTFPCNIIARLSNFSEKDFFKKAEKMKILYTVSGIVRRGKGEGKSLGFPTANISLDQPIPHATYASKVVVGGKIYLASTFVGAAATFHRTDVNVESYLLDFSGDLYGKKITVRIYKKLRNNKKFSSVGSLIEQMKKDVRETRILLDDKE